MSHHEKGLSGIQLSRRTFAATTFAAGATLAAQPVIAAASHDVGGIEANRVAIETIHGSIMGYRAKPKGKTFLPIKLVIQDSFDASVEDVCCRLANSGYYAIAPALSASFTPNPPSDEVVRLYLKASLSHAGREGADIARADIIGFCWGMCIIHQPVAETSMPVA